MSYEFVPGASAHHKMAAELIFDSAEDMCLFLFHSRDQTLRSLRRLCRHPDGHFGYELTTIAVSDDRPCGLVLGYDAETYRAQQFWGSLWMLFATPPSLWWHLAARVGQVVDRYLPEIEADVYYISNFAIAEGQRGKGLGKMLLAYVLAKARSKGFKRCQLDVSEKKTRARTFYKREGMVELFATDHRDLREKFNLPNLVRMSIAL